MATTTLTIIRGDDASLDAVELAYRTLRANVLDGTLPPGSVLSQVTLARELGISRTPLREALRQLAAEGLVVGDFNQRLRVTSLDLEDFDGIYAARIALEPVAIRATIPFLNEKLRQQLTAHVDGMDDAVDARDLTRFRTHHRAFHLGMSALAGSRICKMLADLWDHSERYRLTYLHVEHDRPNDASEERLSVSQVEHRAMLASAIVGNADVCADLHVEHLRRTVEMVFEELSQRPSPRVARIAIGASGPGRQSER